VRIIAATTRILKGLVAGPAASVEILFPPVSTVDPYSYFPNSPRRPLKDIPAPALRHVSSPRDCARELPFEPKVTQTSRTQGGLPAQPALGPSTRWRNVSGQAEK